MFTAGDTEDQLARGAVHLRALRDVRDLEVLRGRERIETRGDAPFAGEWIRLGKLERLPRGMLLVPGANPQAVRSRFTVDAETHWARRDHRGTANPISHDIDRARYRDAVADRWLSAALGSKRDCAVASDNRSELRRHFLFPDQDITGVLRADRE